MNYDRPETFHAKMTTKNKCTHPTTHTIQDSMRCFCGSVALAPHTDENRAAHGNIVEDEECDSCGAQRSVASNGRHVEYGAFGPSLAARQELARQKARERQEAQDAAYDAAAKDARVLRVDRDGEQALVERNGEAKWVWLCQIEDAAAQQDNGDGIVPFYRGLLRKTTRPD